MLLSRLNTPPPSSTQAVFYPYTTTLVSLLCCYNLVLSIKLHTSLDCRAPSVGEGRSATAVSPSKLRREKHKQSHGRAQGRAQIQKKKKSFSTDSVGVKSDSTFKKKKPYSRMRQVRPGNIWAHIYVENHSGTRQTAPTTVLPAARNDTFQQTLSMIA